MKHVLTKNVKIHASTLVLTIVNVECKTILQHAFVHLVILAMHLNLAIELLKTYQKTLAIQVLVEETQFVITEIVIVTTIILEIHTYNVDPNVL